MVWPCMISACDIFQKKTYSHNLHDTDTLLHKFNATTYGKLLLHERKIKKRLLSMYVVLVRAKFRQHLLYSKEDFADLDQEP